MIAKLIWTLYLFIEVYPVQNFGIHSFCIAKSASVGETASISCHFSEDLSKPPEKDVNVYLYRVSVNETEPVLVLYYAWINGTRRIVNKPSYDVQGTLTDHLIVVIYNVTKEHAGDYQCLAVGNPANLCTLHVKQDSQLDFEVENNNPTTSDTGYKDVHLSSSRPAFDENNGKHDDDIETTSETTGNIVAIICSVISVVLIVILSLILVAYRKRWICKSQRSTSDSVKVNMEQRVALNNPENIDLVNGLRQEQGTAPENETSGLGSS